MEKIQTSIFNINALRMYILHEFYVIVIHCKKMKNISVSLKNGALKSLNLKKKNFFLAKKPSIRITTADAMHSFLFIVYAENSNQMKLIKNV